MNSIHLASLIRNSLENTNSRSKLIASLIASVLASDLPLIVAVDNALTMHGYDLQQDAQLGIEVAMRITALGDILSGRKPDSVLNRLQDDDQLAISLAKILAEALMIETSDGFTFSVEVALRIRHLLKFA